MELSDRLSAIEEAQDLLREAKLLIETATTGTESTLTVDSYITPRLMTMIDSTHRYADRSINLDDVIDELKEEYPE